MSAMPLISLTRFSASLLMGAAILILTSFFASFCRIGLRASIFLTRPLDVVTMVTDFSACLTMVSRCAYRFCFPLIAPDRSVASMNSMPCLCRDSSSFRTSVAESSLSFWTLFSASCWMSFFTRSTTSVGSTAMYFMGLPSFITTNPFFSSDSRTS